MSARARSARSLRKARGKSAWVLGVVLGLRAVAASAAIPEPDLIYFGTVHVNGNLQTAADDTVVELRRGGNPIASAALQNLGAPEHLYVLRVSVDSMAGGGPSQGIATLGESLGLALVSASQSVDLEVARVSLGSRGRVTRQDLTTDTAGDFDGDGVPDFLDNCFLPNGGQEDADGNGIGDPCEGIVNVPPSYQAVQDAGNAPDPVTGKGDVPYEFGIGDIEVTNADYLEFLDAVAASDPYGLYNDAMATDPRGGIVRTGSEGSYAYALKPNMADKPVNFVGWLDAARYVNWLENGKQTGAPGAGSLDDGAFDLTVADPGIAAAPEPGATYSLPTEDEWYKAAFFDPTRGGSNYWAYPTMSDVVPLTATANAVGDVANPGAEVVNHLLQASWGGQSGNVTTVGSAQAVSYYGTFDQAGNVREWLANDAETSIEGLKRVARGGSFTGDAISVSSSAGTPDREEVLVAHDEESADLGFRVIQVPEPGLLAGLGAGIGLLAALDRRRKRGLGRRR